MGEYVSRVVGEDEWGEIAVNNDGDAYYVSPCCGATAKGLMDDETGEGYTGCRACYEEIDPALGGVPDAEWFAPHHRERIAKFEEWMREITRKSLAR